MSNKFLSIVLIIDQIEAWKKLPGDLIRKSFKVCALSSSLDGSEDNELMCIKHGPCEELLSRLQSIEEEDIDPFDEITEDDIAQEDVADLQIDSDEEGMTLQTLYRLKFVIALYGLFNKFNFAYQRLLLVRIGYQSYPKIRVSRNPSF